MIKIYKKLTPDQVKRGIVFSSQLSMSKGDNGSGYPHELKERDSDIETNLLDDSFFNDSNYKYNIIRK